MVRFRSRAELELEVIALRHQLAVGGRRRPGRARFSSVDRLIWVWLYRLWPRCLNHRRQPPLVNRLTRESRSHRTASSAKQSTISSFSAEKSKILRVFAGLFDFRARENLRFGRQQLIYARFSLSRTDPVPFAAVYTPVALDVFWLRISTKPLTNGGSVNQSGSGASSAGANRCYSELGIRI